MHSTSLPTSVRGLRLQRMAYAGHVLLDDRALVELRRDVVRGGADQLHTAIVGLVIGRAPLKPGRNE